MTQQIPASQTSAIISLSKMSAMLANGEKLLNNISFSLPEGAKLAIIGANGSGKSTLMRALLGMIPVGVEAYQLLGQPFSQLPLKARAKMISYIGQQVTPEPETTVWEWCELSRFPYQTSAENNRAIILEALDRCRVLSLASRRLINLSGGERQRVYIAGVLAQQTPIIMLDEVSSAMDPQYREAMNQLITSLADKTVISVTHDMNSLHGYSHILALKKGEMIAFGLREELLNSTLLTTLFDYRFTEVWHDEIARFF